ncbi:hypothetical protein TUM12370_03640 [Salmonella enterica subsp. enterica serovar Choleraesuis]|nr:hypothetical protein TUM12370_03640 [Salmonella enterica subsp. enterica serovar Choleraesuis]
MAMATITAIMSMVKVVVVVMAVAAATDPRRLSDRGCVGYALPQFEIHSGSISVAFRAIAALAAV